MVEIESLPPSSSAGLLQGITGKRVAGLVRYSWWPKEEVASECGTATDSAFSLTYGPLGIEFEDGTVLGVAEQPSLNSVVVWLDRTGDTPNRRPTMAEDSELYPIDAKDQQFSKKALGDFVGATLASLIVLKPRSMNALLNELPSEIGLCFVFEDGRKFVAASGIHQVGGDFAVIGYEEIPSAISAEIVEHALI